MSILQPATFTCPACGEPFEASLAHSVNADRRPDLRDAILDGSFQVITCTHCNEQARIQPEMTYLDVGRDQWILTRAVDKIADWEDLEQQARQLYGQSFGKDAPGIVQALGARLQVRICFGWAALREKLLCAAWQLDDVILELVKLALIRTGPNLPLADDTELRLTDRSDSELVFVWMNAADETVVQQLTVPKELYDEIHEHRADWEQPAAELSAGPFVDIHRMLVPTTA